MKSYQINMNLIKFLKLASNELIDHNNADAEELPADSKDLKKILENISALKTFRARIEYSERNMKRLSSGSSRMVFETSDGYIIKLAKNEKGLAQNGVESNSSMRSKYVNGALKSDPDDIWILTEKADKLSSEEFEDLTGMSFEDFSEAIMYGLRNLSKSTSSKKPKNFDKISKNEFYKDIYRAGSEYNLIPGDLSRISSFKKIKDRVVLVDSGLSREIYDEFYEDSKSSSSKSSKKS
jgi:hypothetical protein